MTVTTRETRRVSVGNGVTRDFPVPFQFDQPSDLIVELQADGSAPQPLSEGVGYSVIGDPMSGQSAVRLAVAPLSGLRVIRRRATILNQELELVPNDGAPAKRQERAWDRAIMIAQEQDASIAETRGQAVMVPDGETIGRLPLAANRRGGVLTFDPVTGQILVTPAGSFPAGPPGGSDNTYKGLGGLAAFRASDTSRATASLVNVPGVRDGRYNWTPGNYINRGQDGIFRIFSDSDPTGATGAWIRYRETDFVTPELFLGDLQAAADYAEANRCTLMTGPTEYIVTQPFRPRNITWISDNTRITQPSTAGISVLRPGSNVKHIGRTFLKLGEAASGTANRGHVVCGEYETGVGIENFHFDEFVLEGGHPNCNGFAAAGDTHNIRGRRIDVGVSTRIGRAFMAHWGNFNQHYGSGGVYQHAAGAAPTRHPYDIRIDEVRGDLTVSTGDFCALWCVSAGYDIHVGSIEGRVVNNGAGPGELNLFTAGDLGLAYASPAIRDAGMWGLTVHSVNGQCSQSGVRMIGRALYWNADSTPQPAENYFVKIVSDHRIVDVVNTIGNNAYGGVDGHNGRGKSTFGRVRARNFRAGIVAANYSRDISADIVEAIDCRNNAAIFNSGSALESDYPTNIRIGTIRIDGTGLSETTAAGAQAFDVVRVNGLRIGKVIVDKLKSASTYNLSAITIRATARDVVLDHIVLNWVGDLQTAAVTNLADGSSNIDVGHVTAPAAIAAVSGGVTSRTIGRNREFYYAGGAVPSGITVRVGDRFVAAAPGTQGFWRYVVEAPGVTGSTATVRGYDPAT